MWTVCWWMKKGFCSCRSDLFPSAHTVEELSEVTIASRHFFVVTSPWNTAVCSHRSPFDFSVGMLACPPQCPAIWCQPGIGLISVYFSYLNLSLFHLFLGCLLVVLGSCAMLSKTNWFHAANKNEQTTPTSIFRDATTLKRDKQKYPQEKFEKNNVKALNKLEKAQKKL